MEMADQQQQQPPHRQQHPADHHPSLSPYTPHNSNVATFLSAGISSPSVHASGVHVPSLTVEQNIAQLQAAIAHLQMRAAAEEQERKQARDLSRSMDADATYHMPMRPDVRRFSGRFTDTFSPIAGTNYSMREAGISAYADRADASTGAGADAGAGAGTSGCLLYTSDAADE